MPTGLLKYLMNPKISCDAYKLVRTPESEKIKKKEKAAIKPIHILYFIFVLPRLTE